jgi:flagellar biosynthesis/type III secretory pathway chaperone
MSEPVSASVANTSVVAAAQRLADILTRENAALSDGDIAEATRLLPEKQEATEALARAEPPGAADRAAITTLAVRLQTLTAENRRLLARALAVQRHLLALVARAARPVAAAPRYGASGHLAAGPRVAALALSARA